MASISQANASHTNCNPIGAGTATSLIKTIVIGANSQHVPRILNLYFLKCQRNANAMLIKAANVTNRFVCFSRNFSSKAKEETYTIFK